MRGILSLLLGGIFFVGACATGVSERRADTAPVDAGLADSSFDAPPEDAMAQLDAGLADAIVDAAAADATAMDAGRPCFSDEGCDDGLGCNGADFCNSTTMVCDVTPHGGCDDAVPCTMDACADPSGECSFVPVDALCPSGQVCDPSTGCVEPPPCLLDSECDDGLVCNGAETCDPSFGCRSGTPPACDDGVACTADACDPAAAVSGACSHGGTDGDGDGYVAVGCLTGNDCDDDAAAVNPGASELCNGIDDDCSGMADDGAGMGCAMGSTPSACTTMCGTAGTQPCTASCLLGACVAAEETCGNACDDDGDGAIDEGAACTVVAPPNDLCAGAIALTGQGTRADTLAGATAQVSACGDGVDVFYSFAATQKSMLYLDTLGTAYGTRISYVGTSCSATAIDCNDDACDGSQSQLALAVDAGTHYFAVHTQSAAVVGAALALRYGLGPAANGDNVRITGTGSHSGSTSGSSNISASCGSGADSPEDAYWWTQCPGESRSIRANTCDFWTNYDTVLHLRGNASEITCNDDDFGCFDDDTFSDISGTASGVGLFQIVVDGFGSTRSGSYELAITGF